MYSKEAGWTFDADNTFNITVQYTDDLQPGGIENANLTVWVGSTDYTAKAEQSYRAGGYYDIEYNLSDSEFSNYGNFSLLVDVNGTNYHNATGGYNIKVLAITSAEFTNLSGPGTSFRSGDTLTFKINFTDTIKDQGISSTPIPITGWVNNSVNTYNYTFNASKSLGVDPGIYFFGFEFFDWEFRGYGEFTLTLEVNKTNYHNHTFSVNVFISSPSEASCEQEPLKSFYNSNEILNLSISYNDTVKIEGINDANISVFVNNRANQYTGFEWFAYGDGYYNVSVNFTHSIFNGYGPFSLIVDINKTNYDNHTIIKNIIVYGETSASFSKEPNLVYFNSGDALNISIYYEDTAKIPAQGISGADVGILINGVTEYTGFEWFDYQDGNYNITIDFTDPDFNGYGSYNFVVNVSKIYYVNQTSTPLNIFITGETSWSFLKSPDEIEFDSDEILTVTADYNDTEKNSPILNAKITVWVNNSLNTYNYTDNATIRFVGGNYEVDFNFTHWEFRSYGPFTIKIEVNKTNYYNVTKFYDIDVYGATSFNLISPSNYSSFMDGTIFNITVEFEDESKNLLLNYDKFNYTTLGDSNQEVNIFPLPNGGYNLTIYVNDANFTTQFGLVNVTIDISKQYYRNKTMVFVFDRQIQTTISPNTIYTLPDTFRGDTVIFTFNYSDSMGFPILGANWATIGSDSGLNPIFDEISNGNYTITLNTLGLNAGTYNYVFNISATGNETQVISLTLTILPAETNLQVDSYVPTIPLYTGANQTIVFRINDSTTDQPLLFLTTSSITVTDSNGNPWLRGTGNHNWTLYDFNGDGNYTLRISTTGLGVGTYTVVIYVNPGTNYATFQLSISFAIRGSYMSANLISVEDPDGVISSISEDIYNYTTFIGSDITLSFNLTEDEFGDALILGGATYSITYVNLLNSSDTGTILNDLSFESINESYGYHSGILNLSHSLNKLGSYQLTIKISKSNYENTSFTIYLNIVEKIEARIELYNVPSEVTAGEEFIIQFRVFYKNGSEWLPLAGAELELITNLALKTGAIFTNSTDESGIVSFSLVIPSDAENFSISVNLGSSYKFVSEPIEISNIVLIFASVIAIETIILILILIGSVSAASVGGVAVNKFVIAPKKREKRRVLTEVKTVFEDAINLEHILVLYKGTGTCIFFKSYGTEEIDPELIGGFLSAVSSFGREMVAQEALNEISYGDKMLLLADGTYIRVALVLSKQASMILRAHLKEFIEAFENKYQENLPKWRGQLKFFRDAGELVDSILNTSVILPHELKYVTSDIKKLKKSQSKELLKIANDLLQSSGRKFFFLATLLNEAIEKVGKGTAEIFMGIKELKDTEILRPIDISAIEQVPISQQEVNLITQKVSELTSLAEEEKQKVVQDLIKMTPSEREIYLSSLTEQEEIVTAPIESRVGTATIKDIKSAKKAIKKFKNKGKQFTKKKIYDYAKENYQNAQKVAADWELKREFDEIDEELRLLYKVELDETLKIREIDANKAIKDSKFDLAEEKYKEAITVANDIFKLGFDEMTGKIDELKKKLNDISTFKGEEGVPSISKAPVGEEMVEEPSQEIPETYDAKAAKVDIREIRKEAISARKDKNYSKAIELNEKALSIAKKWEVSDQIYEINEEIRKISLEELSARLKDVNKDANNEFKEKNYEAANKLFLEAASIASEMFKQGVAEMDSEVKKYTNKANECKKILEEEKEPKEKKPKAEEKPKKFIEKPIAEPEEGDIIVKDAKTAKKEIKLLRKNAHNARKKQEFSKASEFYQSAVKLAKVWEISDILPELENQIRLSLIEDLQIQLKDAEINAQKAEKQQIYPDAYEMYTKAYKIASEIFKLGVLEMDKEVKRLTNKAKEFENL